MYGVLRFFCRGDLFGPNGGYEVNGLGVAEAYEVNGLGVAEV